MKNIIVYISLLCCLWSCRITKPVLPQVTSKDSTNIKADSGYVERLRDTVIKQVPDSASIKALLECDSTGKVIMKQLLSYQAGKHLKIPEASIKNNVLDVKCEVDSFSIFLQLKDRYGWMFEKTIQAKEQVVTLHPEKIYYNTWWDRFFIKAGKISLGLLLLFGLYKGVTKRLSIINTIRKWVA